MARPRNEQCPKRGAGLSHAAEVEWVCAHCDLVVYDPSDPINRLRAQFVEAFRGSPPEPEDRVDHSTLTEDQWHRAIIERGRYERGELTDWPETLEQKRWQLHDAFMRLFKRVE